MDFYGEEYKYCIFFFFLVVLVGLCGWFFVVVFLLWCNSEVIWFC